jgi:hypothetical protein
MNFPKTHNTTPPTSSATRESLNCPPRVKEKPKSEAKRESFIEKASIHLATTQAKNEQSSSVIVEISTV